MTTVKIVGVILIVVGALVLLASLLFDLIYTGAPGFGIRQVGGVVTGLINIVLGLILLLTKQSK